MSPMDKENLVEEILTLADKLFRQILPTVPKDLLTLDVTMAQLKIMIILYVNGPTRMSTIASDLEVTLPTATSLLDRLVEKKYVLRENQSDDRRVVLCRLSEAGEKAIGRIWSSSKIRSKELLKGMDTSKLQVFVDILKTMLISDGTKATQHSSENKI